MNSLKEKYLRSVIPHLKKKFAYLNLHEIPKLQKIKVSAGLGLNAQNKAYLQKAIEEIRLITGQHPILTKAKKSIAGFKIREGMPLGLTVTLRKEKMYAFLEKCIALVFPRIRDFRGLNANAFDFSGNYSFGISEQLVFPEIDYENVETRRGFTVTLVTTAKTSTEGLAFLKELGVPFEISEKN
uniref:50S ribosomal protein L5, chloroplastic n=1 Tax=Spumella sp. Baekdong012001B8 TaxID=2782410 RepID=A0A7S6PV73_9STRA|nr:ribosomal protein L5 [Spumella sp. Baekdong012001B8]